MWTNIRRSLRFAGLALLALSLCISAALAMLP